MLHEMTNMLPEDEVATRKLKKKRTKPREAYKPVELEDNKFKVGEEPKKKRRKPESTKQAKEAAPKKRRKLDEPPTGKQMAKVAKSKQEVMQAVEQFVALPETNDPYDIEVKRIFETLVGMASRLEEQMEERIYNRDVYALNTIYSQIREVIADLRASRDISQQVDEIVRVVLSPYHRTVGQSIINIMQQMSHSISEHVKDPDRREELIRKLKHSCHDAASELQKEYLESNNKITQVLS